LIKSDSKDIYNVVKYSFFQMNVGLLNFVGKYLKYITVSTKILIGSKNYFKQG